MLPMPRAPSAAAKGAWWLRLLFAPHRGVLRVEPLLDDLLDLPSGEIVLTGNRGPDHRDLAILPTGRKFHGSFLIGARRGGEAVGHLVGGVDVQAHYGLAHRRVLRGL